LDTQQGRIMRKETRTNFVNRTLGLSYKNVQGKFSYCSDANKQILFSLNIPNGDVILSPNWSHNGYAHSIKHIQKIVEEGYELLIFKVLTQKNSNGKTIAVGFEPKVEKRKLLMDDGKTYRAVPLDFEDNTDKVEDGPAPRKDQTISRIIRNTKVSNKIKSLYDNTCQVCGVKLETPKGGYSEGAHIIPLGAPDHGPDVESNVLCLCPNHHVLLDSFSFTFDRHGTLIGLDGELKTEPSHKISDESSRWHNSMYSEKNLK
jgi:5-methylcytosine-specific restriction protein A